jgi:UDP-2,4-diacetamido-2,4,6-trideoxy-beta-L-altropyranose hydrolase
LFWRALILSNPKQTVPAALFRCDANATLGHGHAARCATLAHALAQRGWAITFAVSPESLTAKILSPFRDGAIVVDASRTGDAQARALVRPYRQPYELLVVDHYELGYEFEVEAQDVAERILVIDDLANRRHHCDWLLDQGGLNTVADYSLNEACVPLMGPQYALLRHDFAALRDRHQPWLRERSSSRLAICMGATDPDDVTSQILATSKQLFTQRDVHVFTTSVNPNLERLTENVRRAGLQDSNLHVDHPDLPSAMLGADVVIGAGGISVWERCALALPSIIIATAENQRGNLQYVERHGAASVISTDSIETELPAVLDSLDPTTLARQSLHGARLCDGRGINRVLAQTICARTLDDGGTITLRPANAGDLARLLAWQREPAARAFARNPRIPTSDEHEAWLARTLVDPNGLLSIVMCDNEPAGMLRLDRLRPSERGEAREVSILVSQAFHRRGIALQALALGHQLVPHATLIGEVLPGNEASHQLFKNAGFRWHEDVYVMEPCA